MFINYVFEKEFFDDPSLHQNFLRSAFQYCPLEIFEYLPDEDKKSVEIIMPGLQKEPSLYRLLPLELRKNADLALRAAKNGEDVVSLCRDLDWKNNRELLMAVLKFRGQYLQYLTNEQRNDFEIVYQAVQSDGWYLKDAGPAMRSNQEIVAAALKNDFTAIQYADKGVLKKIDISKEDLHSYPEYIVYLDKQSHFKESSNAYFDLAMKAIKTDPKVWLELDQEVRNNVDIVCQFVKINAENLLEIPAHLCKEQQVLEAAAIKNAEYVLENFPESRKFKKIVLLYVQQKNFYYGMLGPQWDDYVMENFGANTGVALAVAKKCATALELFDKRHGGKLNINGLENSYLLWEMAKSKQLGKPAVHWEKCLDFLDRSDPMYTSHVFQIVKACPRIFQHVDDDLKSNMNFVKQMAKSSFACVAMLKEAGPEILKSKDKMIEIINYGCEEVGDVILKEEQNFGHLWRDEEILLAILERKPRTLMLFFGEKRDWFHSWDKFVMATYSQFADAMFLASDELKANKEVAKVVVAQGWSAMKYVHDTLKNDLDFVKWALGKDTRVIEFVSDRLKNNMEVAMMVAENINKYDECFSFLSEEMRQNVEVFSCAIDHTDSSKEFPLSLELVFENYFQNNETIALKIMEKHPTLVDRGVLDVTELLSRDKTSQDKTKICVDLLGKAPVVCCEAILGQIWKKFDPSLVNYEIAYQAVLRDRQLVRYIPDLTIIKEVSWKYWEPLLMLRDIVMGRRKPQNGDPFPLIARFLVLETFDKIMDHLVLGVCENNGYLASWSLANTVRMNKQARTNQVHVPDDH